MGAKVVTITSGKALSVQVKEGRVSIPGAQIENHDLQSSNGVIHVLDTVMMKN